MSDPRNVSVCRIAPAVLLFVLGACGGGGGAAEGPGLPTTVVLDMGLVASTVITRQTVLVENTANATATATAGPASGSFALDPLDLPSLIPAHSTRSIGVIFSPLAVGTATGSVSVELDSGEGNVREVLIHATASAEAVTWTVLQSTLAFGEVLLGTTRAKVVRVRNNATVSPAQLSGITLPAGGFSIVGTPLPATVAPGAEVTVSVAYGPTAVGAFAGPMMLGATSVGGPLTVALSGTTGGPVVTDYGAKSLDANRRTAVLTVDVPADAISLSIEGVVATGSEAGLAELLGPSGKVYENTSSTGEYMWIPGEIFSPTIPNTDKATLQLEPGGGTYSFRLFRVSGTATTIGVRAIVERRPGAGTATIGALDLDVWLAKAIPPKAATAASDSRLQSILTNIGTILAQSGIHIGDVRYHDVTDTAYDDVTYAEFGPMLELTAAESNPRLNLFFVRTALGGGVLGVSATLAGPRLNGTELSGVMSLYDGGYSAAFVGLVAAHECGHFLGLYHTAESSGQHDFIDDTADCPVSGTNATCATAGGGYLMHWQAVGGSTLTAGQTRVILGHPCIGPAVPAGSPLLAASISRRIEADYARLNETAPDTWCATCARCRAMKGK